MQLCRSSLKDEFFVFFFIVAVLYYTIVYSTTTNSLVRLKKSIIRIGPIICFAFLQIIYVDHALWIPENGGNFFVGS